MSIVLRDDLDIVQYPDPLPDFGGSNGANTIRVDPNFNTKIVRITDRNTAKNSSLQTSDSPEAGIWNKDDSIIVVRNTGGKSMLVQFDPSKLQAHLLPYTYIGGVCFSKVGPNVMYSLDGTVVSKVTFERVHGVWTRKMIGVVCDFAHILPNGFSPKWRSVFSCPIDDSAFVVGFSQGVQGTGFNICVWQRGHGATKGFRMLDSSTGMISGDWGPTGKAVINSPSVVFPFTIHECSTTPNPQYGLVTPNKDDSPLLWNFGTLNLVDVQASGHKAKGLMHLYGGGPGGGQLQEISYADPSNKRLVVPPQNLPSSKGQHFQEDKHFGFGRLDPNDASIVWASSGGANGAFPFVSAWENEVFGYDVVKGVVYRACHTFDSFQSTEFIVSNAIAVASQTGKFVAFTSDVMGTLGSTKGAPHGTLGLDAAGDVFVAEVG